MKIYRCLLQVQVRSGPAQSGPTLSDPAQSGPAQTDPVTIGRLNIWALKGTHARDFIVRFSTSKFKNRQGQGPEFLKFLKLDFKFSYINEFSRVSCCRQKRIVYSVYLAKTLNFTPYIRQKTRNLTYSLNTLNTANNAQFYFGFLPKTLNTI
jgi:hypothetical protein